MRGHADSVQNGRLPPHTVVNLSMQRQIEFNGLGAGMNVQLKNFKQVAG
jgi:hypothetical protein